MPLPRTLLTSAVVLSRRPVDDPGLAISRAAGRLAPPRAESLAQHIGDLRILPLDDLGAAPVPPVPLLRGSGSSSRACDGVITSSYGWVVMLRLHPRVMVTGEVATRGAAAALAGEVDGVVVDTAIPRAYLPAEMVKAERTSDLITFDHERQWSRGSVTTRGLARFGVPELTATDVPLELLPACDALLVGVADRMVSALRRLSDTEPATLEMPLPLRLTLADVAGGYGEPIGGDPTAERCCHVTVGTVGAGEALVVGSVLEATREMFGDALPAGWVRRR